MKINGKHYRAIWLNEDNQTVQVINQKLLPHKLEIVDLTNMEEAAAAIETMLVRGAPLIGATGAYGMALAMLQDPSDTMLEKSHARLLKTRPTAVNLSWALDKIFAHLKPLEPDERVAVAYKRAGEICDEDVATCEAIGRNGLKIIKKLVESKDAAQPINILTHCNAGWVATVDWGTALAPIYMAHDLGIPVHVWVDETRPRNQGANLTAWELAQHGVPHTVIVDNVGGHLMQHGMVDFCIVGTDRTTATGDVCNKIGTYLKALAAFDNKVPFYVALPHTTIDWRIRDGFKIPIEERDPNEVHEIQGIDSEGKITRVRVTPKESDAANYGFDVTPARLVTGLITERGICDASEEGLLSLYPEEKSNEQHDFT